MQKSIMQDEEEWKEIDFIEGLRSVYAISNYGRVKRVALIRHLHKSNTYQLVHKEKILHPTNNGNGYRIISFHITTDKGIIRKNFYIHRLVATAFIPNPENKQVVNHKDYNRANNHLDNLEWSTYSENVSYSLENMCHPIRGNSGIHYRENANKYEVAIYYKGKQLYVGRFLKYDDALNARNKKFKELGVSTNVGEI